MYSVQLGNNGKFWIMLNGAMVREFSHVVMAAHIAHILNEQLTAQILDQVS